MSHAPPQAPLALIVASHPSVALGEDALAELVVHELVPMLEALRARPEAAIAWHINGHLLDHLARHHEGFLLRLRALVAAGQLEVLGGPFYGGVPALLSEADVRGQVAMASEFWQSFLGAPPRGCLLPDMAWAAELPRLLHDTGLAYGIVSSAQLAGAAPQASFGQLSRGGVSLFALAVDAGLSRPVSANERAAWLGQVRLAAEAQQRLQPGLPLGLLLPSSALGPIHRTSPETALAELIDELSAAALPLRLPASCLDAAHAAVPMALGREYAPLVLRRSGAEGPAGVEMTAASLGQAVPAGAAFGRAVADFAAEHVRSWAEFPARFAVVDGLYRRVLRASERLQAAIERMEDENLSRSWSGQLATAQRAIYRAQASEAFGAGSGPGFVDPRVRDATLRAICQAEEALDALIGPHPAADAEDTVVEAASAEPPEGDLFVSTPDQTVWLEVRQGSLRSVEPAGRRHNLLDAWTARGLLESRTQAPLVGGICDAIVPRAALGGAAVAYAPPWQPAAAPLAAALAGSEQAPATSQASLAWTGHIALGEGQAVTLTKGVTVPRAGVGAQIAIRAEGQAAHSQRATADYALSVPVRLPVGQSFDLEVDGEPVQAGSGRKGGIREVRLCHGGRTHVAISLVETGDEAAAPWALSWQPGATGTAAGEGGIVLVFARPLVGAFASTLTWQG